MGLWRRLWGNLLFYAALPLHLPCKQRQIVSFLLSGEAANIKNKSESSTETWFYFLFLFFFLTGASCEPRQTCEAWFVTSKNTYSKHQWTASNPNFCYWSQSIYTEIQLDSIIFFTQNKRLKPTNTNLTIRWPSVKYTKSHNPRSKTASARKKSKHFLLSLLSCVAPDLWF